MDFVQKQQANMGGLIGEVAAWLRDGETPEIVYAKLTKTMAAEQERAAMVAVMAVYRLAVNEAMADANGHITRLRDAELRETELAIAIAHAEDDGAKVLSIEAIRRIFPSLEATDPNTPIWSDYTIHSAVAPDDSDVVVMCRSHPDCLDGLENPDGRYLTLGEAADWARAHIAWHAKAEAPELQLQPDGTYEPVERPVGTVMCPADCGLPLGHEGECYL